MRQTAPTQPFVSYETARKIADAFGTPAYLYDLRALEKNAAFVLAFPNAFGLTVRYAMKASPNAALLRFFDSRGLHFDASSGFEVRRLFAAGIDPQKISLSTQELPDDFAGLIRSGIRINACSLHQLDAIGRALPGIEVGLRFNPGAGSGGTNRTNVGGVSSSFGIWHEKTGEAAAILARHGLRAVRIHTHIGSGSDPAVWQKVAAMSLSLVEKFPDARTLNLGGGYKVARVEEEKATDLQEIGEPVAELFRDFASRTGRKIHLEIEPGTFLVANAGAVLAKVQDVVDTGADGYCFLKLDTGMTEILRPSLYGSQHPIWVLQDGAPREHRDYVVVGHCCESGDILTPASGEPELLATRKLPESRAGDLCFIGGAGAYCAGMAAKNYNSFPEAPEILIAKNGEPILIRRRQEPHQIWQNECLPENF